MCCKLNYYNIFVARKFNNSKNLLGRANKLDISLKKNYIHIYIYIYCVYIYIYIYKTFYQLILINLLLPFWKCEMKERFVSSNYPTPIILRRTSNWAGCRVCVEPMISDISTCVHVGVTAVDSFQIFLQYRIWTSPAHTLRTR